MSEQANAAETLYPTMQEETPAEGNKQEEAKQEETPAEKDKQEETPAEEGKQEETPAEEDKQEEEGKKTDEDYVLNVPDEHKDRVDEQLHDKFSDFCKEHGVPKEKAEEFLNAYLEREAEFEKDYEQQVQKAFIEKQNEQISKWEEEARADKEIGGQKFDESVQYAKRALDNYGAEGVTEVLEQTGLGSHPAFIKMFAKIGQSISEDGVMVDQGAVENNKNPLDTLYPSMAKYKQGRKT